MKASHFKSRLMEFFSTTLWELEPETFAGMRRHGLHYLQILTLVVRNFRADQCLLRASALTFTSILSLVPFFALTFAVLKGFGVHNKVEPLILNKVAAGSQEIVDWIVTYIDHTNMTSLGAIGLVTLIMTVISVLGNIEEAFNQIWGVRETRSIYRKFSDYLSVVITGPLLLLAAVSITTSLQSQSMVMWVLSTSYLGDLLLFLFRLAPFVTVWLALVFLYIFIPNTRVRMKSALIGGVVAGTLWQMAQWGYIHFQLGVAKYNAIYGTLSILPVFMVWIYVSWLIVLFGVEIVSAHQNIRTFLREERSAPLSHGQEEAFSIEILTHIASSFQNGTTPLGAEELAERLGIPSRGVHGLLDILEDSGFIAKTAGEIPAFIPAREPETIMVKEVLDAIRDYGAGVGREKDCLSRETRGVLNRLDRGTEALFEGISIRSMALCHQDDGKSSVREKIHTPMKTPSGAVVDKQG